VREEELFLDPEREGERGDRVGHGDRGGPSGATPRARDYGRLATGDL